MYFPEDIVEEILLRSHVKSLLRFRSVSKAWGSLISSSPFAKLHLQRTEENPTFRIQNLLISTLANELKLLKDCTGTSLGDEAAALVSLYFPPRPYDRPIILGSCNGLVALCFLVPKNVFIYNPPDMATKHVFIYNPSNMTTKNFFIWNPSTGDYKKLPESCFPYDCTDHGYVYGFGYDSVSDDYKVFFGRREGPNSPINTAIFSLRKNSWRLIGNPPDPFNYCIRGYGVFANRALYWPICIAKPWGHREISVFDLNGEKFDVLSVPLDYRHFLGLGAVKDKLCIIFSDGSSFDTQFWVMEDYGNDGSWTKLLTIKSDMFGYAMFRAFCISESHVLYTIGFNKLLRRYDAEEENVIEFRFPNDSELYEAIAYTESLLSPNLYCNHSADEQHCDNRKKRKKGR